MFPLVIWWCLSIGLDSLIHSELLNWFCISVMFCVFCLFTCTTFLWICYSLQIFKTLWHNSKNVTTCVSFFNMKLIMLSCRLSFVIFSALCWRWWTKTAFDNYTTFLQREFIFSLLTYRMEVSLFNPVRGWTSRRLDLGNVIGICLLFAFNPKFFFPPIQQGSAFRQFLNLNICVCITMRFLNSYSVHFTALLLNYVRCFYKYNE